MGNLQENIKFFDKIARYYDNPIFKLWFNKSLKCLLKKIKIKNNSAILDVGFGTGCLLKMLSENRTLKLYGIDISPKMIEIAKSKLKNKAKLELIPIEQIKYRNKFNYIFSTEAFHHYENQELAMRKFNLALKKGGILIIVDLNFGKGLNWVFHKFEPGNSKMNSKEEFKNLFKKHGFKNIKQRDIGLFIGAIVGKKNRNI